MHTIIYFIVFYVIFNPILFLACELNPYWHISKNSDTEINLVSLNSKICEIFVYIAVNVKKNLKGSQNFGKNSQLSGLKSKSSIIEFFDFLEYFLYCVENQSRNVVMFIGIYNIHVHLYEIIVKISSKMNWILALSNWDVLCMVLLFACSFDTKNIHKALPVRFSMELHFQITFFLPAKRKTIDKYECEIKYNQIETLTKAKLIWLGQFFVMGYSQPSLIDMNIKIYIKSGLRCEYTFNM